MTHPYNEGQKATYFNSSFKLCKERKYDISRILVKKYKDPYFLWQKSKRYHKSFTKASKVVFTIANASVYTPFL